MVAVVIVLQSETWLMRTQVKCSKNFIDKHRSINTAVVYTCIVSADMTQKGPVLTTINLAPMHSDLDCHHKNHPPKRLGRARNGGTSTSKQ